MFLPLLVNLLEAPRRIHQISQVLGQVPQQGLQPELQGAKLYYHV